MKYEIVLLPEMIITGLSVRTGNTDPEMGLKIGGLWQRLYGEGVPERLTNRIGESAYGLYTHYESDVRGEYDAVAGCQVAAEKEFEGLVSIRIPAGPYARFSLTADMGQGGIGAAWQEIWALDLKRSYTVDFEEYLPCEDSTKAPVNIYIALAEHN